MGHGQKNKEVSDNVTSVSLAFRTAVTVRGAKSSWRGAQEQQSLSHSSTSCTSRALTGSSDPEPGPATTPSTRSNADASGSSAVTEQTREVLICQALHNRGGGKICCFTYPVCRPARRWSSPASALTPRWRTEQRHKQKSVWRTASAAGGRLAYEDPSSVPSCRQACPPVSAAAPPPGRQLEAPLQSWGRPQRSATPARGDTAHFSLRGEAKATPWQRSREPSSR